MSLIRVNHNPSRRQLQIFALLWLIAFALLGLTTWRHGHGLPAYAIWVAGIVVPLLGAMVPGLLRIVYLTATYATLPVGLTVSLVTLLAVYYLVISPLGLLLRLLGHDPMQRRFDRGASTYWSPREKSESPSRYFRQF
jgi:hypothetical protein